jgi:hypothetical protein
MIGEVSPPQIALPCDARWAAGDKCLRSSAGGSFRVTRPTSNERTSLRRSTIEAVLTRWPYALRAGLLLSWPWSVSSASTAVTALPIGAGSLMFIASRMRFAMNQADL